MHAVALDAPLETDDVLGGHSSHSIAARVWLYLPSAQSKQEEPLPSATPYFPRGQLSHAVAASTDEKYPLAHCHGPQAACLPVGSSPPALALWPLP